MEGYAIMYLKTIKKITLHVVFLRIYYKIRKHANVWLKVLVVLMNPERLYLTQSHTLQN